MESRRLTADGIFLLYPRIFAPCKKTETEKNISSKLKSAGLIRVPINRYREKGPTDKYFSYPLLTHTCERSDTAVVL